MRPAALLLLSSLAAPAMAQDALPSSVRAMIESAAKSGDKAKIDAVVAVAKETNPQAAKEIDTIVADIAAEQERQRVAALATAGPLDNWKGTASLGGSIATGNTDAKNIAFGLDLVRDGLDWRHRAVAAADVQRSNGVTDQERLFAAWQSEWKLTERFYVWGRFEYEKNLTLNIQRRFVESIGAGYRLMDRPTMRWDVEAGPALRQTKFFDGTNENSFALRAGSRYAWDISKVTRFTNDTDFYIENSSSITNTAAITTMLFGNLSAGLSFAFFWQENPGPGLQTTSTITRFTLGYAF
jgi:putative salt-induced outer membrane protein